MIKVKEIQKNDSYSLQILFSNGEIKLINFASIIQANANNEYFKILAIPEVFTKAKVGKLGEIYWENIATIKELDGSVSPCNFDFSPEFIYAHAK